MTNSVNVDQLPNIEINWSSFTATTDSAHPIVEVIALFMLHYLAIRLGYLCPLSWIKSEFRAELKRFKVDLGSASYTPKNILTHF